MSADESLPLRSPLSLEQVAQAREGAAAQDLADIERWAETWRGLDAHDDRGGELLAEGIGHITHLLRRLREEREHRARTWGLTIDSEPYRRLEAERTAAYKADADARVLAVQKEHARILREEREARAAERYYHVYATRDGDLQIDEFATEGALRESAWSSAAAFRGVELDLRRPAGTLASIGGRRTAAAAAPATPDTSTDGPVAEEWIAAHAGHPLAAAARHLLAEIKRLRATPQPDEAHLAALHAALEQLRLQMSMDR